ncbi:MAG: acyl-CoA thioesterase [Rhodomicrobiaceae bacterium]
MDVFRYRQKVQFQHCDPAGIVFYPRYFEMVNETLEEWFARRIGVPFETLHGAMAASIPTVVLQAEFTATSRHGDLLDFTLRPTRIGLSSLDLAFTAHCGDELRLKVASTVVYITKEPPASHPWPDALREAISREIRQGSNDNA